MNDRGGGGENVSELCKTAQKLEEVEASHILGGAGEGRIQGDGGGERHRQIPSNEEVSQKQPRALVRLRKKILKLLHRHRHLVNLELLLYFVCPYYLVRHTLFPSNMHFIVLPNLKIPLRCDPLLS